VTIDSLPDPVEQLSRVERRRWLQQMRQAQRAHEADQLAILHGLAAELAELGSVSTTDQHQVQGVTSAAAGPVEAVIGERHLIAGRVSRAAWATLEAAVGKGRGPVRLVGAGRYGPYWTLMFEAGLARLIVLADRVVLIQRGTRGASETTPPVLQLAG